MSALLDDKEVHAGAVAIALTVHPYPGRRLTDGWSLAIDETSAGALRCRYKHDGKGMVQVWIVLENNAVTRLVAFEDSLNDEGRRSFARMWLAMTGVYPQTAVLPDLAERVAAGVDK